MDDLRELYQSVILDHNKRPRNFREISRAGARPAPGKSRRKISESRLIYLSWQAGPTTMNHATNKSGVWTLEPSRSHGGAGCLSGACHSAMDMAMDTYDVSRTHSLELSRPERTPVTRIRCLVVSLSGFTCKRLAAPNRQGE